ncbi:MAG: 23S rRNA (guanosine(2251)-2'-O)-methyltransferase RlmB [Clostridia bacterium]|nr:23S rRNA (guanosine(2251)-2'-O)-methyltransferase RlmB [Clostridia bacterium]
MDEKQGARTDLIVGRNAVLEALQSGRAIDSVWIARGDRTGSIGKILHLCREKGVVVKDVDEKKLSFSCGHANHQGVAAFAAAHEYAEVEDIFALAASRGEAPFILVCDEVEDPHNLGAILRSAEAAGAHGVIIPKRRSASLSWAVAKTSAGAIEYVPVARVPNIPALLEDLKKRGVWIYAADMDGQLWCDTDFGGAVALVIGSEGRGVGRLVRERCDFTVSLPMHGKVNSLNASVAAGILLFEVARQRMKNGGVGN